jgi:hypothetical protein
LVKRILDPDFRYRPSYDTDVRATFDRARREQRAGASGPLEGGELAVEERRGHVAVLARRNARSD